MSLSHILIVAVLALLLFGRGKVSELMGDVAKGIRSFKKGLAEDEPAQAAAPRIARQAPAEPDPAGLDPAGKA